MSPTLRGYAELMCGLEETWLGRSADVVCNLRSATLSCPTK